MRSLQETNAIIGWFTIGGNSCIRLNANRDKKDLTMQWKQGEKFLDGGKQPMCEISELVFCFTLGGNSWWDQCIELHNTISIRGTVAFLWSGSSWSRCERIESQEEEKIYSISMQWVSPVLGVGVGYGPSVIVLFGDILKRLLASVLVNSATDIVLLKVNMGCVNCDIMWLNSGKVMVFNLIQKMTWMNSIQDQDEKRKKRLLWQIPGAQLVSG